MNKLLNIFLSVIVTLPALSQAEIYKWKDSKGSAQYSDLAPPANVPAQVLNVKKAASVPAQQTPAKEQSVAKKPVNKEEEAAKRQQSAEEDKKKDQAKEEELKQKQENCKVAKANYQIYKQGGRIYKMNEKGEREYQDDTSLAKGLEQAQNDMKTYCTE